VIISWVVGLRSCVDFYYPLSNPSDFFLAVVGLRIRVVFYYWLSEVESFVCVWVICNIIDMTCDQLAIPFGLFVVTSFEESLTLESLTLSG
jgi:hypothetical protein